MFGRELVLSMDCFYDRKVDQVESFSGFFFSRNDRESENSFYLCAKKYPMILERMKEKNNFPKKI